jgi:hypothetical protein
MAILYELLATTEKDRPPAAADREQGPTPIGQPA